MKGQRLPLVVNRDTGRPDLNRMTFKAGDYAGPIANYTGGTPAVFFMLPVPEDHPDHGLRHVCAPPHAFTEEDDGTLTISPSILARRSPDNAPGWHGFLERGVWREA